EEIALEVVEAQSCAEIVVVLALDFLGQQPHRVLAEHVNVVANLIPGQRNDVDLDQVGQTDQRLQRFVVDEIVQCNSVTLIRKAFDSGDDLLVDNDILEQLQYHPVLGQRDTAFADEKRASEIDKRQVFANNIVEADFQERVDDDIGGCLVAVSEISAVVGSGAKQQLVAVDAEFAVVNWLTTDINVTHFEPDSCGL